MARKEDPFPKALQPYPLRRPPCALLWSRRSMLKDGAAATGTKHLCPSQRGGRDFRPERGSGSSQ